MHPPPCTARLKDSECFKLLITSLKIPRKAPQGLPENVLERLQDCYPTCTNYSSLLCRQTLLRQKTFLPFIFPFQTFRLTHLGECRAAYGAAKARKSREQLTYRSPAPNGGTDNAAFSWHINTLLSRVGKTRCTEGDCPEERIHSIQVQMAAVSLRKSKVTLQGICPAPRFVSSSRQHQCKIKDTPFSPLHPVMEGNMSKQPLEHTLEDTISCLQSPQEIVMPDFLVSMREVKWQPGVLPPSVASDISWMSQQKSLVKHLLTDQQPQEVKQKEYKGANLIAPESFTHTLQQPSLARPEIHNSGCFCSLLPPESHSALSSSQDMAPAPIVKALLQNYRLETPHCKWLASFEGRSDLFSLKPDNTCDGSSSEGRSASSPQLRSSFSCLDSSRARLSSVSRLSGACPVSLYKQTEDSKFNIFLLNNYEIPSQTQSICQAPSFISQLNESLIPAKNNLKATTSRFHTYLCIYHSFRGSYKQSSPTEGAMELVTTTHPKELSEGAVRKFEFMNPRDSVYSPFWAVKLALCLDKKTLTSKRMPLTVLFCDSVSSSVSQRTQPSGNFTILLLDFLVQLSSNNKMLEEEDNSQPLLSNTEMKDLLNLRGYIMSVCFQTLVAELQLVTQAYREQGLHCINGCTVPSGSCLKHGSRLCKMATSANAALNVHFVGDRNTSALEAFEANLLFQRFLLTEDFFCIKQGQLTAQKHFTTTRNNSIFPNYLLVYTSLCLPTRLPAAEGWIILRVGLRAALHVLSVRYF
ncbi:hypothetical protein EK904_012330 [Melospiza melodia maxima]|nr:hypothetical protein EK904_012330 [Melospiza melodia maxima]